MNFAATIRLTLAFSFLIGNRLAADPDPTWYENAGFGIFLHWGAYSQSEGRWQGKERNNDLWGEWIKNRAGVSVPDYEAFAKTFNPVDFKPQDWAQVFKDSGVQYVVLTAKHHEGFAMFHTNACKFNSYDWPDQYHGDPVRELGDAVRSSGLKFGVYYSQQVDWCNNPGGKSTFANYFNNICVPQVTELTTKYGPMAIIWFDIGLENHDDAVRLKDIVRQNQPDALISARLGGGVSGDYRIGGDNEIPATNWTPPWETCMTLTQHWASYPQDVSQKSAREVIQLLAEIRSKGGNMLLDVGPDYRGRLAPRDVVVLREVGSWMKKFGNSIYGVRPDPLARVPWGRVTFQEDTLYLHLFDIPSKGEVLVPGIKGKIESAWLLGDPQKTPLPITADGDEDYRIGLNLEHAPVEAIDPNDMVVVVKLDPGATFDNRVLLDDDFTNELQPAFGQCAGGASFHHDRIVYKQVDEPGNERARYDDKVQLGNPASTVEWKVRTIHDGDYHLVLSYACKGSPTEVKAWVDGEEFSANVDQTKDSTLEHPFTTVMLGTVALRTVGDHVVKIGGNGVEIYQLALAPSRTTPLSGSVDANFKPISAQ